MKKLKVFFLWWLVIPHVLVFELSKHHNTICIDIERWMACSESHLPKLSSFINVRLSLIYLLLNFQEFRNVFYLRSGKIKYLLSYLRPLSSLYIWTKNAEFGAGTYIQHGFATVITAKHIGVNCWINQQVTIGYSNSKSKGLGNPWIGDNVRVSCGAKVCGPITVGNNCTIGANAVVVKDVPDNTVVIPSPTVVIEQNGVKCNKKL